LYVLSSLSFWIMSKVLSTILLTVLFQIFLLVARDRRYKNDSYLRTHLIWVALILIISEWVSIEAYSWSCMVGVHCTKDVSVHCTGEKTLLNSFLSLHMQLWCLYGGLEEGSSELFSAVNCLSHFMWTFLKRWLKLKHRKSRHKPGSPGLPLRTRPRLSVSVYAFTDLYTVASLLSYS